MKTRELIGPALDWAVAKCEGDELTNKNIQYPQYARYYPKISPSTDWLQGGPIIERESITIAPDEGMEEWTAALMFRQGFETHYGPTPLIAAMRCHVASKLGDEVEIPEELT